MILMTLISCVSVNVLSQSCSIPQPLTKQQIEMIDGEWIGYYLLNGQKTEFSVQIKSSSKSVHCQLSNPPLAGEIQKEEYRFCGAGAFHFRKETGENHYEFDGVPDNGIMKGTLAIGVDKKKIFGQFYLKKDSTKTSGRSY